MCFIIIFLRLSIHSLKVPDQKWIYMTLSIQCPVQMKYCRSKMILKKVYKSHSFWQKLSELKKNPQKDPKKQKTNQSSSHNNMFSYLIYFVYEKKISLYNIHFNNHTVNKFLETLVIKQISLVITDFFFKKVP